MYYIQFAPDGKLWQTIKKFKTDSWHTRDGVQCEKAWRYFSGTVNIRQQIAINPYAKFRLLLDDRILAELPIPEEKGNNDS